MIELDGSEGEGGGQILRSSLSLSAITQTPFHLFNVRANRRRPGLRRQHLTCVLAVAELTDAELDGAELGSRKLWFRPRRPPRAGDYRFDIGTAGSTTLLLQAVLWPLVCAGEAGDRSIVTLEGGTHNPMAPPFEFLARTFAPAVRRAGVDLALELERAGFYPKGGGRIRASVGGGGGLDPIELEHRGEPGERRAVIVLANLPDHIAEREAAVLGEQLGIERRAVAIDRPRCRGAGNVLHVALEHDAITEVVTGFGERGVPAERVASLAAAEALGYLESDAPVGEHLADQLVIPLALAGGGAVRCTAASLHTRTNVAVVSRFLPDAGLALDDAGDGTWWLRAGAKPG